MVGRIPLHGKYAEGQFALVDDEDYGRLSAFRWSMGNWGYALRGAKVEVAPGVSRWQTVYMHKDVLGVGGGAGVDHVDGDRLNNTRNNLRFCTPRENRRNRRKQQSLGGAPCSSIYKGVSFMSHRGKWSSTIKFDGKSRRIGTFADERHAALAYDREARRVFGEFAHLNFPDIADYSELPERPIRLNFPREE